MEMSAMESIHSTITVTMHIDKCVYLKCADGSTLESQICLEILSNFSDKSLKWQLPDKKLGRLLVPPDLSQSHGTRSVSVGLLHSASGGCTLAGSLGGQLLSGSLSSSRLTGGLFRSGHCLTEKINTT